MSPGPSPQAQCSHLEKRTFKNPLTKADLRTRQILFKCPVVCLRHCRQPRKGCYRCFHTVASPPSTLPRRGQASSAWAETLPTIWPLHSSFMPLRRGRTDAMFSLGDTDPTPHLQDFTDSAPARSGGQQTSTTIHFTGRWWVPLEMPGSGCT